MYYEGLGPALEKSGHLIMSEFSMNLVFLIALILAAGDLIQTNSVGYI